MRYLKLAFVALIVSLGFINAASADPSTHGEDVVFGSDKAECY